MTKAEKSIQNLNNLNQWITNCDTKSSIILAFYGVIITIIFTSEHDLNLVPKLSSSTLFCKGCGDLHNFIILFVGIIFYLTIFKTAYHFYHTLIARFNPEKYKQQKLRLHSNHFFTSISSKSFKKFRKELLEETNDIYLDELYSQIYINSIIADRKFKNYNKSLKWLVVSLATLLIYIFLTN